MRDNLLLYHTITAQKRQWLPGERITRVRNLALFLTGLYLSRKVHLFRLSRCAVIALWTSVQMHLTRVLGTGKMYIQ